MRARARAATAPLLPPTPNAAWLITGGGGGLGRLFTTWAVLGGCTPLIVSRRARAQPPRAAAARGATVAVADVGTRAGAAAAAHLLLTSTTRPAGALHAAGELRDALLPRQGVAGVRATLAGKVGGAAALAAATATTPLPSLAFFSSMSTLFAPSGQANCAAANAALAAMAHTGGRAGAPTCAFQWGAWGGVGMAVDHGLLPRVVEAGLGVLPPAAGVGALEACAGAADVSPSPLVSPLDWRRIMARAPAVAPTFAEFAEFWGGGRARAAPAPARPGVAAPSAAALRAAVRSAVTAAVGPIPDDAPLMDAGLDSVAALNLRTALAAALGAGDDVAALPPSLAFDHPTVDALTAFLVDWVAARVARGRVEVGADQGVSVWAGAPAAFSSPSPSASTLSVAAIVDAALTTALGTLPDPHAPLTDAGLDSVGAVDVRASLARAVFGGGGRGRRAASVVCVRPPVARRAHGRPAGAGGRDEGGGFGGVTTLTPAHPVRCRATHRGRRVHRGCVCAPARRAPRRRRVAPALRRRRHGSPRAPRSLGCGRFL